MKQTITVQRVERRVLELEVPQALTTETLTALANSSLAGVGGPAFGHSISHVVSSWTVTKGGAASQAPSRKQVRKGRGR